MCMRHDTSVPVTTSAPGLHVIGDPVAAHHAGDRLLRDRERAAEPAALVGARERHELDPLERREQARDLVVARLEQLARAAEPELAQPVAALVERRPCAGSGPAIRPTLRTSVMNSQSSNVPRLSASNPGAPARYGS